MDQAVMQLDPELAIFLLGRLAMSIRAKQTG
jgi:hypothetical protein